MRHNRLHSVAHNFADSQASGIGFVIGVFVTNVFADAARNGADGLVIDFLSGVIFADHCSAELRNAVPLYRKAFPGFCDKHDVKVSDYRTFHARFIASAPTHRYIVTVEDDRGRISSREYEGASGRRVMQSDALRRLRPKILDQPDADPSKP